ncbi:class I SAM-dependent methyltransferase [Flavitalea flava]
MYHKVQFIQIVQKIHDPNSLQQTDDPVGLGTLELFSHADAFNRWMFQLVAPYCRGKVLEIGSGIGNISGLLLEQEAQITLSDLRPGYCTHLKQQFHNKANLEGVYQMDLLSADPEKDYPSLIGKFDAVIALNVIEHIGDDGLAVRNCRKFLKPGGRFVILVPAFQALYNGLDKELGHFRRYNRKGLTGLLREEGMKVTDVRYFNGAGILGWWIAGSLLGKKAITSGQLSLYSVFLPVFRLLDKLTTHLTGLSVIAVAEKPEQ